MGGIFGSDAPEPPDPKKVAAAQADANIKTAQEQARLAMTGQTSDFGSLTYVKDPNSPSGYRAVSTLAPESQALLAQQRDIQANLGDVTNTSLNNVANMVSGGPFDLTAARGREISDIQQTFLDPQWENNRKALESQLINKGVRPGSTQYDTAMRQFSQQRGDAYNKMFLDAFTLANNAALTERSLPMQDYQALMGTMKPVSGLPTPSTPTPGVAPTDVIGPTYQSYNAAAQQAQSQNAGLWNLAGTIGSSLIMSDRDTKTDIEKVGKVEVDGKNLWVYAFRYKGEKDRQTGLMADEVKKVRPEAVKNIGGIDHVDYGKALA